MTQAPVTPPLARSVAAEPTAELAAEIPRQAPQASQQGAPERQPASAADDDLPPWVTEFSDDSASAVAAPLGQIQAAKPAAPKQPPRPYVLVPVPALGWDGNWPAVAAALPLRGVAQQLAVQAELIECVHESHVTLFKLRVPIETWRSQANVDKLAAALSERFNCKVQVETELGAVWYTASAEAQAHREATQRKAEETIENDPFVQSMMRDFDAIVVPGSITPPASTLH